MSMTLSHRAGCTQASRALRAANERRSALRPCAHAAFITLLLLLQFAAPASAFTEVHVGPNCPFHTIQQAINAAVSPPTLMLVAAGTYDELVSINNKGRVAMFGGYSSDCTTSNAGTTTISGANHVGDSVITVSGASDLFMSGFTISDGVENSSGGHGGGIDFGGHGSLELQNVTITNNFADYGGGLDVTPDGATTVMLDDNVLVSSNTAGIDGGGIHIDGPTRLFILLPQTLIFRNHANRNGGGIDITGPARADIGSPGFSFFGTLGVIWDNSATNGGGISAVAHDSDNEPAVVRLFTTDPNNPVTLQANSASNVGGAVYLKPFLSASLADASAALCAYDFRIVDNGAPEGAAIYADTDLDFLGESANTPVVALNVDDSDSDFQCNPESTISLGGLPCADGIACNEIAGNFAQDAGGNPTNGAAVFVTGAPRVKARHLRWHGNAGGHLLESFGRGNGSAGNVLTIDLKDSLIAENNVTGELIHNHNDDVNSYLTIDSCTIAHDVIGGTHVIGGDSTFFPTLSRSILYEPGTLAVGSSGSSNDSFASFVLANDISTLGLGSSSVFSSDPLFVDYAGGDYHLQPASPAIDFAPATAPADAIISDAVDLDGAPRVVDLPGIPVNESQPRDLGAYERQSVPPCSASDEIFCTGFQ